MRPGLLNPVVVDHVDRLGQLGKQVAACGGVVDAGGEPLFSDSYLDLHAALLCGVVGALVGLLDRARRSRCGCGPVLSLLVTGRLIDGFAGVFSTAAAPGEDRDGQDRRDPYQAAECGSAVHGRRRTLTARRSSIAV